MHPKTFNPAPPKGYDECMNNADRACHSIPPEKRPQNGSVLLVTLLVVSLLMVVVLTLLVSVRMGLREVTSSQQNLEAQTNARLGVELAIAQLQKHAGPDQRITAPATTVFPEKDFSSMTGEMYTLYRNRAEEFGGILGPRRTEFRIRLLGTETRHTPLWIPETIPTLNFKPRLGT